jgi:CD109 antigen
VVHEQFHFSPRYKITESVKIKVSSAKPMKKLNYHVVSLGKDGLISSGTLKVENKTEAEISFWPSISMMPKARVVVFYLEDNGKMVHDKINIEFEKELQNFVS